MKAIVLLNSNAGTLAAMNEAERQSLVADVLSSQGVDADVRLVTGANLVAATRAAIEQSERSSIDLVIAGGGDGTLGTVAAALAGTGIPLGILPLGTLNRFAKDLGLPLDLEGAAGVIAAGNIESIDLGEINGRVFINNSSLGIYPLIVLDRDAWRKKYRLSKWTAMGLAVLKVFRIFPMVRVRLTLEGETIGRKTPFVFVGNNEYQFELLRIGKRKDLNRGELSVHIANARTRWRMLKLTLRALVGQLVQSRDFESFRVTECTIETRRQRIHAAADGEVLHLAPPLCYRVRAGALQVFVPADKAEPPSAASREAMAT